MTNIKCKFRIITTYTNNYLNIHEPQLNLQLYNIPALPINIVIFVGHKAIQFQKVLSDMTFQEKYRTEAQCETVLETMRWPDGFIWPERGGIKGHRLDSRNLHQCASCRQQTWLTSSTIIEHTMLPLSIWFRGMYQLTKSKNGVSAMELIRQWGVSYNTAWMLKQKLMQVMPEREARTTLTDRLEIDDAYIGGERKGGKVGRGALRKTPFAGAEQTDWQGKPQRMALREVSSFINEQIRVIAKRKLKLTADVYTDGLACLAVDINQGCSHIVSISGCGRKSVKSPKFKCVNTALDNIKSAMTVTYRHVSAKHAAHYLAEFQYRFNRSYDLAGMLSRLSYVNLRTPPMSYKLLKLTKASTQRKNNYVFTCHISNPIHHRQ